MSIIPKELTDEQLAEYFREYVDGCHFNHAPRLLLPNRTRLPACL